MEFRKGDRVRCIGIREWNTEDLLYAGDTGTVQGVDMSQSWPIEVLDDKTKQTVYYSVSEIEHISE
jgi:hypothetical protein